MSAVHRGPNFSLAVPGGPLRVAPAAEITDDPLRLSLVVPTYNESANIAELIGRLAQPLDAALRDRYEIIIVDDRSPDRTFEEAVRLCAAFPRLRVMRRDGERGLATAVVRGWQAARGEVLGVMDADLQHPPEVAPALYAELERGVDLVLASRYVAGGAANRSGLGSRLRSRVAQLIGLLILPQVVGRVSDPMSGYFMVRRTAIQGIELTPRGYKILLEILSRGRCASIREVPYVFRERRAGASKDSGSIYLEYLLHLLRLRWSGGVARAAGTRQASRQRCDRR
jgi:dolichol-phosphate mannosyltransferase